MLLRAVLDSTYHVLGERLGKAGLVALLNEVAERKGVLVGVAGSEALVGHVEEGVVTALLDCVADLLPLRLGGVNTGRVVRASVQQNDAALGHLLDVLNHAIEVETDGVLVVVAVLLDLEAAVGEDGLVVGPRRGRDVDGLRAGVMTLEEGTAYPEGAGAGDALSDDNAALVDGSAVGTVGEERGGLGEVGDTGDASVLLVEVLLDDLLLGLSDGGQHVGLALVITVGTDTEVDLLGVGILLEGLGDTENGIGRTLGHLRPGRGGAEGLLGDEVAGVGRGGALESSLRQHCE